VLHQHLDVGAVGEQRLGGSAKVALAVRRVLEELALPRQVAARWADVPGRLHRQQAQLAVGDPAVRRGRGDDDVVAGADRQGTEDRLDHRGTALDVHALVADRVAVERRRPVGHDVGHPDIGVCEEVLATEHRVAGSVELVGLEVPGLQRVVGLARP
jgi:hypothetical protein